jgi:hypothetical protein
VEGTEQPHHTTTSTPSRTKRHTSKPTTRSLGLSSPSTPSSASSAASSRSRSQEDSSRQSTWPGIPTPRSSRQCGSATNASLGWRRYSPRNPPELSGCEGGSSGHVAAVPPTCPKQPSAAVIQGQPRSVHVPAELWDQPVPSGPRVLPKLAVGCRSYVPSYAERPRAAHVKPGGNYPRHRQGWRFGHRGRLPCPDGSLSRPGSPSSFTFARHRNR